MTRAHTTHRALYDGDTFERNGHEFTVRIEHDEYHEPPWEDGDERGIVSDWTTRAKGPGERLLCEDRRSKRYFDWAETIAKAKREQWGISGETDGLTRGQIVARAVEREYELMRQWCADLWYYASVTVEYHDLDTGETIESESLSGVESHDDSYVRQIAEELADEILSRIAVAEPDVQLSEN